MTVEEPVTCARPAPEAASDGRDVAVREALVAAQRDEWARIVGALARRFGSLDLAEECAAGAVARAVERWPVDGVPAKPGGWLTTTATRQAIDHIRRESRRADRHREALRLEDRMPAEPDGAVVDDRLRLLVVCCHPVLAPESRVALTLRTVAGLTVAEIARAFLVPETTVARRITRAKARIASAGVPWQVPDERELVRRCRAVLDVVYLVFTEGHQSTSSAAGADPSRPALMEEAIRLARLLCALLPRDGEVVGLLALMLLTAARNAARASVDGLRMIGEQDRASWDHALIAEGLALVRARLDSGEPPGRFQLLAAVNAVHVTAPDAASTDWTQILALYDQLVVVDPSPVARLARAVAVAEVSGPSAGLEAIEPLRGMLDGYDALHAARAELLGRGGLVEEARTEWERAMSLTRNAAAAAAMARRRDALRAR